VRTFDDEAARWFVLPYVGPRPGHGTEPGEEQEQPGAEQRRPSSRATLHGKKAVGNRVFASSPAASAPAQIKGGGATTPAVSGASFGLSLTVRVLLSPMSTRNYTRLRENRYPRALGEVVRRCFMIGRWTG
jgi:hypothetical protein